MTGRVLRVVGPLAIGALALAAGTAKAASAEVEQASGTVMTLLGMGFLLWVIGNLLSHHRYNTRGPKGEKLPPAQ